MENFIASLDAEKIALIVAVTYGVLSDIVGESKRTKAGSLPGFLFLIIQSLAKNIPSARGNKK